MLDGEKKMPSSAYDVNSIVNYNGTGRTLLKVHIKEQFYRIQLLYTMIYTWDSIIDYGRDILNSAAYETGNDEIADGYPDDGGDIADTEYMKDLDPESDGNRFIYTQSAYTADVITAANSGLSKSVKNTKDFEYGDSSVVHQNGLYMYRLRYSTNQGYGTKNMIFFDSLENFSDNLRESEWKGTLEQIDTSQMSKAGADPVIYYSSVESLDISRHHDLEESVEGEKIWKTEAEFGDISGAKAVAIDLRYDKNGDAFVLPTSSSVVAILYMRAPAGDNTDSEDPMTYNSVYLSDSVLDAYSEETEFFIRHECTAVNYRIMADINIEKVSSEDKTTPVKGVSFRLEGMSDYGTETDITLESDINGRLVFTDIEKGAYTLKEIKGSDDYLPIKTAMSVRIDNYGAVTINGTPVTEGVFYHLEDEPRVHSDITFYKSDLADNNVFIKGASFELSGVSDYHNEINMKAISDSDGLVVFKNVEKGTYKLKELRAVDGHILDRNVYIVTVSYSGLYSISVSESEGAGNKELLKKTLSGVVSICNEPYHSFTIQKEAFSTGNAVKGAEFELKGENAGGNQTNIIKSTNDRGQIVFSGLESGVYTLTETKAPSGYELDKTVRTVNIDQYGNVEISDSKQDSEGRFVIINKENGSITITKKWVDHDTNATRTADPVIHLSTDINVQYNAYFGNSNGSSVLSRVAPINSITSFAPFEGEDAQVQELIEHGTAVKIDDGKTECSIYAWKEDDGSILWWSDAKNVYLTDAARWLWKDLTNCTSINFSGINASLLTSGYYMFAGDSKLEYLDMRSLDTSSLTDMSYMFNDCSLLKNITFGGRFNTSKVVTMEYLFRNCRNLLRADLRGFDTSNVVNMCAVFINCQKLENIDLSSFNTQKLVNMSYMFQECHALKIIDLHSFDTSNVNNMLNLFANCLSAEDILVSDKFVTDKVTTMDGMFSGCRKMESLSATEESPERIDVRTFNTSSCTTMYGMFNVCENIKELDLRSFDTSSVTNMTMMFSACYNLESVDLSSFDTSQVTNMGAMFRNDRKLKMLDLRSFDTSKNLYFSQFFEGCSLLTEVLVSDTFVTDNILTMTNMFSGCSGLKSLYADSEHPDYLDIRTFNTSKVNNMSGMFSGCSKITDLDLRNFNTSSVTDFSLMFAHCSELVNVDVSSFDTSKGTTIYALFLNDKKLETLDLRSFNTANVKDMRAVFRGGNTLRRILVSTQFVTDKVTTMAEMFSDCYSLTSLYPGEDLLYQLDIRSFNTSRVTDMSAMFSACKHITELDLRNFDTGRVTNMNAMFSGCTALEALYLSSFHTASVTNTASMFRSCNKLEVLDLRSFDTSAVLYMNYMFAYNPLLKYIYVSDSFVTVNVSTFDSMFAECPYISTLNPDDTLPDQLDIRKFNTTKATLMQSMFTGCKRLVELDLTSFDTSSVTNMYSMFRNCTSLETIKVSDLWNTDKVTSSEYMFMDDRRLMGGYGTAYTPSVVNGTYARVDTDQSNGYLTQGPVIISTADEAAIGNIRLSSLFPADSVRSFMHYTGRDAESIISTQNAKRIDDCSTSHKIYVWLDSSSGTLYWWADTDKVCLTTGASILWKGLNACTNISLSGIDTSEMRSSVEMFAGCTALSSIDLSTMDTHHLTNMSNMFNGCLSLRTITFGSNFDTSKVVYMTNMFLGCSSLEQLDLSMFDTSSTEGLYQMFGGCSSLTRITFGEGFKADKVESFGYLFSGCSKLAELDLSSFRPMNNKTTEYMFNNCSSLERIDFDGFVTSEVTAMSFMFKGCTNLKELDLSSFDTRKVTTMSNMFRDCKSLTSLDLDGFQTPVLSGMASMFEGCMSLESLTMSNFNTSRVGSFESTFYNCNKLKYLDLSSFTNTSSSSFAYMFRECVALETLILSDRFVCSTARYLQLMFYDCKVLKAVDLSHFDTSNVTHFSSMFEYCRSLEIIDVSNFDTSNAVNMSGMFRACEKVKELAVEGFNTSKVSGFASMFDCCNSLRMLDLRGFDTRRVGDFSYMFRNCESLEELKISSDYITARANDLKFMFQNCRKLRTLATGTFDTQNVKSFERLFEGCNSLTEIDVSNFKTSNVTRCDCMFSGCRSVTELDVSHFDTSKSTTMNSMFRDCRKIKRLDLSSFDGSNVKDFSYIFDNMNELEEIILPEHFVTEKATNLCNMFSYCSQLKNLDITAFESGNVTNMSNMFLGCSALTELDISKLNTYHVTNTEYMFYGCRKLKALDASSMYTANVTKMTSMFRDCCELTELDLRNFDTHNVTIMNLMFFNDNKLQTIYVSDLWNTDNVANSADMFLAAERITGENGTRYNRGIVDKTYAVVDNDEHKGYLSYRPSSFINGTAFVSTDSGCIIEKIDDTTWTYTFTGLNPSFVYYAWEDELDHYVSSNLIDNALKVKDLKGTITNTITENPPPVVEYGSLTILKKLAASEGTALTEEDMSRSFAFDITITNKSGEALTDTALYGTVPFHSGKARVRIKGGESITLTGIPEGYHYLVTELPADGFTPETSERSGVIVKDETAQAVFTNTKNDIPEKYVSVTLKKLVTGVYENESEYSFTIHLSGMHREQEYMLSDGTNYRTDIYGCADISVTLMDGEEITVQDIPVGAVYRISEDEGDYISSYVITDDANKGKIARSRGANSEKNAMLSTASETADEDEQVTVTFTNTLDKRQNLEIKKVVANASPSNTDRFTFNVKLTGLIPNEQIMTGTLGVYHADNNGRLTISFALKAGEKMVFYQLPAGAQYIITESGSDYKASYTITDKNGKGNIVSSAGANDEAGHQLSTETETVNEGEEALVIFTNTKVQHDMTVTKMVDMTYGNLRYVEYSKQEFMFHITFDGLERSETYTIERFSQLYAGLTTENSFASTQDGTAELDIVLKHGESAKVKDLPVGAHYTVTERAEKNYISSYEIKGNEGAVVRDDSEQNRTTFRELSTNDETVDVTDLDIRVTFTNSYSASDYVLPAAGGKDQHYMLIISMAGMMIFAAIFTAVRVKSGKKKE